MKNRILSILLAMSFILTSALYVQAEEADDVVAEITGVSTVAETAEGNETAENETANDEEVFPDPDIIYNRREVYSINFNNGVANETNKSDDTIMKSWLPADFTRKLSISNSATNCLYGAAASPGKAGDKALKVSTPSTLTSAVTNNYLGMGTAGTNPDFADAASVNVGENGYMEFSFDFYNDFNTNIRLAAGRFWDQNNEEVNKNTNLLYIYPDGRVILQGNTDNPVATLAVNTYKNTWHNIKFVFRADNKYCVFLDSKPLIEWTELNFGEGKSVRGVKEFRLYNIGAAGEASEKYYDNFKYVVYTDVTDQYEPPTISFGDTYSPVINIEEGDSYSIKLTGNSVCPEKINVYVDGELAEEYYGGKCEYTYTGTPGEHLVEAELVDTTGSVSEKIGITFKVAKRIVISGQFNDGETSGEYSDDEPRTVTFKATAEKGFDRVEFYVNGKYASTSSDEETEFSFEEFGTGQLKITAVVYNAEGDSKEFEYIANVTMERLSVLWSEAYESYTTGTTKISDYIQIAHKNGYSKSVEIDSAHGTSMALGIEQDLGSDSGEYVNFHNPKGTGHIIFETDFYVSDYPADDAYIRLGMVQESSVQNSNFMLIGSDINKGETKLSYETKAWNHLKLDVDMTSKVYSVFINDAPFVTNVSLSAEKPNFESLNYIRVYGPSKDGVPCYIAFDNTILKAYESYTITSVTSAAGSEEIRTSDRKINVYLSEGINPDTLSADKITIESNNKALQIGKALYDEDEKCITIEVDDVFIGGREYTLELSETLETAFGEPLGSGMNKTFSVKSEQRLFLTETTHKNDSLIMNITSEENIQAYMILSVWDSALCKGQTMVPVTITAGDVVNVEVSVPFAESGDTFEMYAVETLTDFEMLTDDIIRIEKP